MSFTLLGILNAQATGAGSAYFFSLLGGASILASNVTLDSDGNIYGTGAQAATSQGSYDWQINKYAPDGSVLFQKSLGASDFDVLGGVVVDSTGNIHVAGRARPVGSDDHIGIAKYNSSGTLQFQKAINSNNFDFTDRYGDVLAIDINDNIYLTGFTEEATTAGGSDVLLVKLDTSGTLQWQRILGGASNEIGKGVTTDSAGNVYVCGETESTGQGDSDVILAKYNSSGTIQWQRSLGAAFNDEGFSMSVDSLDNVYVAGKMRTGQFADYNAFLAKYNSSGTLQWQRELYGNNVTSLFGYSVKVDSGDNVYLAGEGQGAGALLAKYNSAGTLQWQRNIFNENSTATLEFSGLHIDANDDLFAYGEVSDNFFLAKLPNDGSLTGSYTVKTFTLDYQPSSYTDQAGTQTGATSSLTASTSTLSEVTTTMTETTTTFTDEVVGIG